MSTPISPVPMLQATSPFSADAGFTMNKKPEIKRQEPTAEAPKEPSPFSADAGFVKTPAPKSKSIMQHISDDITGAVNGKKHSFTRGYASRLLFDIAPRAALGLIKPHQIIGATVGKLMWETAYQMVNRFAKARGGNILPQFADAYEKENGKHKDKAGSARHVMAQLTDDLLRMIVEAGTASALYSGAEAVLNRDKTGKSFMQRWTKGGDHGNGEFIDESRFYSGVDTGLNFTKLLGMNGTWPGAALAAGLAGAAYHKGAVNSAQRMGDKTAKLSINQLADKTLGRTGIIPNLYGLPNLSKKDKAKNAPLSTAEQQPKDKPNEDAQKEAHERAVKRASFIKTLLYPLVTFGGFAMLPKVSKMLANKNIPSMIKAATTT